MTQIESISLLDAAQPAPVQDIEHCIWARNGNTPCPHTTQPAAQRQPQGSSNGPLDFKNHVAAEVFGLLPEQVSTEQRRYAKVINFGLIYGMSSYGLAKALAIDTTAASQDET